MVDEKRFQKIREDLVEIFPPETDEPRLQYVRRTWIFPNHIDIAVDFARQLTKKYQANVEVVILGALLHDAGLAYKRESADPAGHENRSIEYAQEFLPKYGYDKELIDKVVKCIDATEPEVEPATLEAKIVRSADAMSHMLSVHYLAKTKFASDWESGISFVEKKIQKDFSKICLDDERELVRPIYEYFSRVIEQYRTGEVASLKEWAE